jgi:DNA invertase Pin-like site-specific DNA recombinase
MNVGYAKVLTDDRSLDLQRDALTRAGCSELFEDRGLSGEGAIRRPELEKALARLGSGDVLTVWTLNRLGRSLPHFIETVRQIGERGAGFASLSEAIGTRTAGGALVFHIMGALAESERSLIVERVTAGIVAAKKRGKHIGRPRKLTPEQIAHAREAIEGSSQTSAGMAELLGVNHTTLWRAMRTTPAHVVCKGLSAVRYAQEARHGEH